LITRSSTFKHIGQDGLQQSQSDACQWALAFTVLRTWHWLLTYQ